MADFNQLAHRVVQATVAATEPASEQSPEPKIAEKKPVAAKGEKADEGSEQR